MVRSKSVHGKSVKRPFDAIGALRIPTQELSKRSLERWCWDQLTSHPEIHP